MKKIILMISLLTSSLLFVSNAFAASSEVTWTDYKDYRDINPGNGNRSSFRESVFHNLEEHFAKLAATLPEGQTLKIDVTDVDLAGDTRVASINDIRVIKEIYPPRMTFSYVLENADGSVVQTDEVQAQDMSFMTNSRLKYRNDMVGYEKKMLDDWFEGTFQTLIIKN
ncbi:DUF3016 domain-containing protein [Colwellia echini]|uniref:DUF3016 domain-containing protein n=1 Tax=Colwellia echini TaxID=1982103 RepID=A0ABY3MXL5_9GAMM|nr:DUF3016 domain-containing protein [Colwellia echini]TYK65844.1 DUF3016 domain-containing protein [Colwellia echini]